MGGFKLQIEDRAGLGFEELTVFKGWLWRRPCRLPELAGMMASFQTNAPQLQG